MNHSVLVCFCSFVVSIAFSMPLGTPGQTAEYAPDGDISRHATYAIEHQLVVTKVKYTIGAPEQRDGKEYQWLEIAFTRMSGAEYTAQLLMDGWPEDKTPRVARYLWREPTWPEPLEYVNETTGKPVLPRFSIWEYGFGKNVKGFPEKIEFQGWGYKRAFSGKDGKVVISANPKKIKLNPDLLIGHCADHRDRDGKPYWELPNKEYKDFVKETEEDWQHDIDAGMNFVRTEEGPVDWLWDKPVYVSRMFRPLKDWPAYLYRSNYFGRAAFLDEPAIHHLFDLGSRAYMAGTLTPAEAAKLLEQRTSGPMWQAMNNYSAIWINQFIDNVYGRGSLSFVEKDYPVWESVWSCAWYELAAGAFGIVDEDFPVGQTSASFNRCYGTQIPATIQNDLAIRVAALRGAARNFDKSWGIAFYTPMDIAIRAESIPYCYERGARYFWFWNTNPAFGDSTTAHIPYSYRRYLMNLVRSAYANHPDRDMSALLKKAKVAVLLPYGYTFDAGPIQRIKWLHLERKAPSGLTYRQILANAAVEVERLLRNGQEFDIAVDDRRFKADGYEELIYILEDGRVKVVDKNGKEDLLKGPRIPFRPELGAMPSLEVRTAYKADTVPTEVELIAEPKAGSGTLAVDSEDKPVVSWEIFTPDNGFIAANGAKASFKAQIGGVYKIRAATNDIFGRPAFSEVQIEIKDPRQKLSILPDKWKFSKDPDNLGLEQKWHAPDFDDSGWMTIAVPSPWEEAIGAYDGYGWYRVNFQMPSDVQGVRLDLEFNGVDESAWVYWDGQLIGERTQQSTGEVDLATFAQKYWDKPFTVSVSPVPSGGRYTLAVRVLDTSGLGGIFMPVNLYVIKEQQ